MSSSSYATSVATRFCDKGFHISIIGMVIFLSFGNPVLAQAPVNDLVSWPAGLLLLATILYASLGSSANHLWEIEPATGFFMWSGLPLLSIPAMKHMRWASSACHFIPGIRSAFGTTNLWVRSEEVTPIARTEALNQVLSVLSCVVYEEQPFDASLWSLTTDGLVHPSDVTPLPPQSQPSPTPSAHDFLLFAAIEHHAFDGWEVNVHSGKTVVFSTKGLPYGCVIDVISEESALPVVAAQMVCRPHSQSPLRNLSKLEGDDKRGPYVYHMDSFSPDSDMTVCKIDFHSYAPEASKVSATLRNLAGAYYRVVQFIKNPASPGSRSIKEQLLVPPGRVACISIGQSLWIAILGGVTLDTGRLTIQNLPGKWQMKGVPTDEAHVTRVEGTLKAMEQHVNKSSSFNVAFSGGLARHTAHPFLATGLFGQVVVCYFLSVGTSAGVWTSVVLVNSLFAGKLTDRHSMFHGKTPSEEEPGMKLYVPGSKELMAIATFDRSTPREIRLRPGLFLNLLGVIAAVLGAIFQQQTRSALNF